MNEAEALPAKKQQADRAELPPGPKGGMIMGVMREFNRDTLDFVTRCRDYGDVVHTRFLYVHAYFLYNPSDIESLLTTNAKSYRKARSLRSPFFHRLVGNGLVTSEGDFWRRQRRPPLPPGLPAWAAHRQAGACRKGSSGSARAAVGQASPLRADVAVSPECY